VLHGNSLGLLPRLKRVARVALGDEPWISREIRRSTNTYGRGYGAWRACPDGLTSASIVYSFGVGEDASFDLDLIDRFGLQLFAFDPTPRSIEWVARQKWPGSFHFSPYGIAGHDGSVTFYPPKNASHVSHTMVADQGAAEKSIVVPVQRLETIARMHGHGTIDILKLDVEGAEYDVIDDLPNASVRVRQLLVEFHHRLDGIGAARTKRAVKNLHELGFRIFAVSASGEEYSFMQVT
jgi:FkbM family methyltransferase